MPSPSNQAEALRSLLTANVDLCGLKDIGTARSWDYSLPTIGAHRGFTDRHNFASDASFFDIFQKEVNEGFPYRVLESVGAFDENNSFVLFGGEGVSLTLSLRSTNPFRTLTSAWLGKNMLATRPSASKRRRSLLPASFPFFPGRTRASKNERR